MGAPGGWPSRSGPVSLNGRDGKAAHLAPQPRNDCDDGRSQGKSLKDNDPQTVGELLNRIGNKGRASAPPQTSPASTGKRRTRARVLLIALLLVAAAAAAVYFLRDSFIKTGKRAVAVRARPGESPARASEAAAPPVAPAVRPLSPPPPHPSPSAKTKGPAAPHPTPDPKARPGVAQKSAQPNPP